MTEFDKVFAKINADLDQMNRDLAEMRRAANDLKHQISDMGGNALAAAFITFVGLIVVADIAMWLAS